MKRKYKQNRGGAWDSSARDARCADRYKYNPGGRNYYFGFRCFSDRFSSILDKKD